MTTLTMRPDLPDPAQSYANGRVPLGHCLVEGGVITPAQLLMALHLQQRLSAPLGEILVAQGWASGDQIQSALAAQFSIPRADFAGLRPDPALAARLPPAFWLRHRCLPWTHAGGTTLIATERPDLFEDLRPRLADSFGPVAPVQVSGAELNQAITACIGPRLARGAGCRVPARYSCRSWHWALPLAPVLLILAALTLFLLVPGTGIVVLGAMAVTTLMLFTGLRLVALLGNLLRPPTRAQLRPRAAQQPRISVIVPLYREKEIAAALLQRLSRLTYPKSLLEVLLVLEEKDEITRRALSDVRLPHWIRVVEVPDVGPPRTKPRAMNYALDFCRGTIIGVWDAEDAPASDQLERVADHFARCDKDVACLQGVLDYYNPRTNWIARCFTIEYAAWFRVILPGMARLGMVVPLGGTTLFFRRDTLEELGGWDAHNVTEDADLGIRLCRMGYRTEMIPTVTYEEANCRPWAWIKQRSRWLKGFLVTYLVHMRAPRALLRDLGAWRFLSFQAFFLGTVGQFLLAPVLWSFWLLLLGLPHPARDLLGTSGLYAASAMFLLFELLSLTIGMMAVTRAERRFLMIWTPSMLFYFPLATIAACKALLELVLAPHFWDKTEHGVAAVDQKLGEV